MERKQLEEWIKEEKCIPGGTKEACIKIREVLKYKMNPGNQLHAPGSCVNIEEFIQAVEVLMIFAAEQPDKKVSRYYCETDCIFASKRFCPGKLITGISQNGIELCPDYIEEDK